MKITRNTSLLLEPVLLFLVFFLPGYLYQNMSFDPNMLLTPAYQGYYLVLAMPQLLYLLYLMWGDPKTYGLKKPKISDLGHALFVVLLIFLALTPVLLVSQILRITENQVLSGLRGSRISPALLPLLLVTSLITGYREELFFRSFLYSRLLQTGISRSISVAVCSLLFAAGHLYQGPAAFIGAMLIATVLAAHFIRHKNLNALAVGHGVYNFILIWMQIRV